MSIDVTKTPFSKSGAWIAVLADSKSGPLTILNPHEHFGPDRTLALTFEADVKPVEYSIEGSPSVIGKGLRAAGYTWTAAVNILLMEEYLSD